MAARSFLYGCDSGDGDGSGFNSALMTNKRVPGCSSKPRDLFFVSGSSHSFEGSRSMVSFEDGGGASGRTYFQTFDQDDDEYEDYFQHPEKKRRLKADQVRFLEKSFETENKLEPERKVQLAKELGLQPRQIAIWFQNRRARLKTKQLEKDYNLLQQTYNILKANYKNLLQEKERLKSQVVDLNDKLLLQETEKGSSDSSSTKGPSEPLQQDQIRDCVNDEDISNVAYIRDDDDDVNVGVKRPRSLLEQGGSSNYMFDEDHSDESLDEDHLGKMLVGGFMLPKIESPDYPEPDCVNSCYLGFPGQDQDADQSFGFWSLLS